MNIIRLSIDIIMEISPYNIMKFNRFLLSLRDTDYIGPETSSIAYLSHVHTSCGNDPHSPQLSVKEKKIQL